MKALLFTVLLWSTFLSAQTTAPVAGSVATQVWPDRIWNELSREVDRSGTEITNVLFDLIDEISVFNYSTDNGNSAKVKVKRAVMDNQDVLGTWTVNDKFSVKLGRSATEFNFPLIPSVITPVNFNLGVEGILTINHMRQVTPAFYSTIPTVEETQADLLLNGEEVEREPVRLFRYDPSLRPRLSKYWYPFIAAYRIPLTKEGLSKIGKGDIISYTASGHVSVGLETSLLPIKLPREVDLNPGVGVVGFLKGEFRITILKEDERYVRVKLTRMRSRGGSVSLGAKTNEVQLYEGYLLFEGKSYETRVLDDKITVVPFQFTKEVERKKQFDLGYRFDLQDEEAEKAFEKAVLGDFKSVERVAATSKAVSLILDRKSLEKRQKNEFLAGMSWFIKGGRKKEKKDIFVTIKNAEGQNEIFKSSLELSRSWSTVWGTGEKKNFLFTALFDQKAFERKDEDSFQLVAEGWYEDVRTSGKEIRKYIRDIEMVVGNDSILPELPLKVPKGNRFKKARYKRSTFYFGQYFNQKQLLKFILTDPLKAKEIARKSFEYVQDLDFREIRAENFYKDWMRLQIRFTKEMTSSEMIEALKDLKLLFKRHTQGAHAMQAILLALDGEEIDYFVSATNQAFGRIQFRGRANTQAERLLQLADETLDFENRLGSSRPDPKAVITEFEVKQQDDSSLLVKFKLPEQHSQTLFFKLIRTTGWKKSKVVKEVIYSNKLRFRPGGNTWVISKSSQDTLDQLLYGALKETDYYTMQISTSLDGASWGRINSSRFKFTKSKKN